VIAQQPGEILAGFIPVVLGERVADVLLVAKQALEREARVGEVRHDADDDHAAPDDVVLPQPAEVLAEGHDLAARSVL
jgi:hypothetical protein